MGEIYQLWATAHGKDVNVSGFGGIIALAPELRPDGRMGCRRKEQKL